MEVRIQGERLEYTTDVSNPDVTIARLVHLLIGLDTAGNNNWAVRVYGHKSSDPLTMTLDALGCANVKSIYTGIDEQHIRLIKINYNTNINITSTNQKIDSAIRDTRHQAHGEKTVLVTIRTADTVKTTVMTKADYAATLGYMGRLLRGKENASDIASWNVRITRGSKEPLTITHVPAGMRMQSLLWGLNDVDGITMSPFTRTHNKHSQHMADAISYVQIAQAATFNARSGGKTWHNEFAEYCIRDAMNTKAWDMPPQSELQTIFGAYIEHYTKELVAKRLMQATNTPDNPAQPNEQSRSQSTKEGNTTMSQVNHSVPVQTLTFVFGQRVDLMGKTELFTAAQAVAAQIAGLKKSNESVGSVAIEQEIASLEKDLVEIRKVLDTNHAAPVLTGTAATAE